MPVRPALIPGTRYRDAPAAIDFLCRAFGFERHAVYANPADTARIDHAQLTLEGQMFMLSSARADAHAALYHLKTPAEAGGVTMGLYVVVDDPDAHHVRATAAGAAIIEPPHANEGYSGRSYGARDPEGHVWTFGSYDPWAEE